MGKKTLPYIGMCFAFYLLISVIEIFLGKPLIDFIGFGYRIHLILYMVLLLLVNPLIVRIVTDKMKLAQNEENIQRGELL